MGSGGKLTSSLQLVEGGGWWGESWREGDGRELTSSLQAGELLGGGVCLPAGNVAQLYDVTYMLHVVYDTSFVI